MGCESPSGKTPCPHLFLGRSQAATHCGINNCEYPVGFGEKTNRARTSARFSGSIHQSSDQGSGCCIELTARCAKKMAEFRRFGELNDVLIVMNMKRDGHDWVSWFRSKAFFARWRSVMARLNLNRMLSNAAVNAGVAKRFGRGTLVAKQAPASLSQGWPVPTGPGPNVLADSGLRLIERERDPGSSRAGRSAVSLTAGGVVSCCAGTDRRILALLAGIMWAYPTGFCTRRPHSDMCTTRAR
jgi:hypothetical protein